jgi:hypothetical protein
MMQSRLLFLGVLTSWASCLLGQNETDIFRYSFTESLGSARTMGMGGAFGALGADLACLTGNPAGIGLYRRGDASLTTGFASQKNTFECLGTIWRCKPNKRLYHKLGNCTHLSFCQSRLAGEHIGD